MPEYYPQFFTVSENELHAFKPVKAKVRKYAEDYH